LALVFVGFSQTLLQAIFGEPPKDDAPVFRDTWRTTAVPAVGLALVLVLGLWIPAPLQALFTEAQATAQQRSGLSAVPAADASQGQVAP
jgi:hydrogenase-4 component F